MVLMVPAHTPSTPRYPLGSFVTLGNLCSYPYPWKGVENAIHALLFLCFRVLGAIWRGAPLPPL